MQACVLDRDEVGRRAGLVAVSVPHAGRGDERAAGFPVDPGRVHDIAALVQTRAKEGVAAGLGVEDQVERDRLMPVRPLLLASGQQAEHRPQHVGDRQGLLLVRVRQQDTDPALVVGPGPVRDFRQFGDRAGAWELGARNFGTAASAPRYVTEPGYDEPDGASIIDPVGTRPAIGFLRVPEAKTAKTAKNRMHIDIRVAGEPPWDMPVRENLIRAKVAELAAAGATAVREEFYGEYLGYVVMLDPERNEFCVA